MEIAGYILAIIIGMSLGLIGSGGSILTIPILVYIMKISPNQATTYSLFIVGISALFGSIKGAKQSLLDFKVAIYFGLPSVISIFIMRKYLMPDLPNTIFTISNFILTKDLLIMLVFSVLMIIASISMIQKQSNIFIDQTKISNLSLFAKGIFIGLLTGFVGVGGGFLIIPTLLFSAKLPMKKAVATSLIIIAVNSLIGFCGSINNLPIDWFFLIKFSMLSILGIFIGKCLNNYISNEKLKPAFGWFVLIMGIYIIIKETILK